MGLLGLDTGITSGHATFADVCFLAAVVVFFVAMIVPLMDRASVPGWAGFLVPLGLALLGLGLFTL